MSEQEQIVAFSNDLDNLIDRYRDEFDLSYASVIGSLYMKAHLLMCEASEQNEEEDE